MMKKGFVCILTLLSIMAICSCSSSKNLTKYDSEYVTYNYDNTLLHIQISDEDTAVLFDIEDDASFGSIYHNSTANKLTVDRIFHHMSNPLTSLNDEDKIIELSKKALDIDEELVNEKTELHETYVSYSANVANTNYIVETKLQRTQDDKITVVSLQYIDSDEAYIKALKECFDNVEIKKCITYDTNSEETNKENTTTPAPKPTSPPVAPTTAPATPKPTHSAESVSNMLAETRSAIVKENYGYVNYDDLARNPNSYKGKSLTYEGKIAQLMEDSDTLADSHMVFVQMRLAVGGNYNNIVWVSYLIGSDDSRFLENDYVQIYGKAEGLYTYTSTMGKSVTIPSISADLIEQR